jgi:hypothetical protein
LRFDLAGEADDAELRRLLRESPMDGRIRVALEREPNSFLAGTIEGELHQVIVARDVSSGRVLGMGSRSVRQAFVNGQSVPVGYLSQLRIDPEQRGNPRMLAGGFAKLRELHRDGAVPFYVTTIIEDNRPARRILEARLAGLPAYHPLERFSTLVLPVKKRRSRESPSAIERGVGGHVDEVVDCLRRNARRYQFAPSWSAEDLVSDERTRGLGLGDFYTARRNGRIAGCLACWDQRSFKQAVVRGYDRWLGLLRPLVNLVRAPRLPRPGGALDGAFVSHVAVDGDDASVLLELLTAVYDDAAGGGFDHLIVGFAERNPLLPAVKRAYTHREYTSIVYAVHWEDGAESVRQLDGRVAHLETATL